MGRVGVFLSLRLIMGRRRIKKSLPSCIHLCPRLWRSLPQNTPLDDTTCGYQKRRGEEDFGERKKKTDVVFFDRAFCWGASTTREPLSLYIYVENGVNLV